MSGPNREKRRQAERSRIYVPAGIPRIEPAPEPEIAEALEQPKSRIRFWHVGPYVDRFLRFANLTPNGCGLLLLFVATLAVVAMAAAAWLR